MFIMASEAIYFLFILYYMFVQVSFVQEQGNKDVLFEVNYYMMLLLFVLTGQTYERAEMDVFQKQVESFRVGHHYFKLECTVCFCQEDDIG